MPNDAPNSQPAELFDQLLESLGTLLDEIPRISQALGRNLNDSAWQAMQRRYRSLRFCRERHIDPPLVAVLLGPTEAGKSTLFQLLTGLDVPAGVERRPMSRSRVIAVPPELADEAFLRGIFPDDQPRRLQPNPQELQQLTHPHPTDVLFCVPSNHQLGQHLIVADVPDFDTVEEENWERAERMLQRAELVIYLVQRRRYADERPVDMLAKCCSLAGTLICVFTHLSAKNPPEAADVICRDLLEEITNPGRDERFGQRRADGRTLHQFLEQSYFYWWPFSNKPRLEDIHPVNEAPPVLEFLHGQLSQDLVTRGFFEGVREGIEVCCALVQEARRTRKRLRRNQRKVDKCVSDAARAAAEGVVPVGRLIELAIEEARSYVRDKLPSFTPRWLQKVPAKVSQWFQSLRQLIPWRRAPGEGHQLISRDDAERHLLRDQIERLCDCLRQQIPELAAERLEKCKTKLLNQTLPPPHQNWEDAVRRRLRTWARNNPKMAYAFALLMKPWYLLIAWLGLALPGWFILGLGSLVYIVGGGGIAWLLHRLAKVKLERVAKWAHKEWVKSRAEQLKDFISEYFIQPLIESWNQRLQALDLSALRRCEKACDFIRTYLRNLDP
jgi:energy-coupling factor transporter ATP-binding protein EcfA2